MRIRGVTPALASLCALLLFAQCGPGRDSTSTGGGNRSFRFPTTGVAVETQAMLLAIDELLLPLRENVSYYLSKPDVRKEPVLRPSRENPKAPDQVAAHFYGTVLQDGAKFRMWYYACYLTKPGDASKAEEELLNQGPVCYAESDDGITWTKPSLGQVEIHGSKENNAIFLPDDQIETVSLIKEENEPNPQRRYKMVYNAHNGKTWVIRNATSADGIHWNAAADFGIDQFIETSSFYRFNNLYVVHGQRMTHSEGGHPEGRQGRAIISPDFDRWLPGHTNAFLITEPADPAQRGTLKPYDQVHLGIGAASFGNVLVGLYGLWHNQPGKGGQADRWGWFGYARTSADLGLVISNDGLHFREPLPDWTFTRIGEDGKDWDEAGLAQGQGFENIGDKTFIWYSQMDQRQGPRTGRPWKRHGGIGLLTMERDRFGSLGVREVEKAGTLITSDLKASGPVKLWVNAEGLSPQSSLRVELLDMTERPVPGYSGEHAAIVDQSGLRMPVIWKGRSQTTDLKSAFKIRVNFDGSLRGAISFYALYVASDRMA